MCDALKVRSAEHLKEISVNFKLNSQSSTFSSLFCGTVQYNTQQFPHIVIYSGKGVVFLTAVKVRDIVSREAGPMFREQKEFTAHPHSLPLSPLFLSMSLSLQCVAREAACSSSGWLVWSR